MKKEIVILVTGFCFVLLFLFPIKGFGQIQIHNGPVQAAPGTYRLRTSDLKVSELFTDDILYTIEANRDSLVQKIIVIGTVTTVRILPYSMINAPGFIPLPEGIIPVEEDSIVEIK